MQTTFAVLAALAAVASAQGVPAGSLVPTGGSPPGAVSTYDGKFEITVVLPPTKRDLASEKRQTAAVLELKNGILTDAVGRIGGIVANGQFQFDGPPSQTGTIYNGGWSVLTNGSLAIGPSAVFYQCLSGSFYNLYDRSTGAQCQQVLIDIIPLSGAPGAVTQSADGQPGGPSATQIPDGQVQATSAKSAVTQISDGQIQASSAKPVPVTQISDGQIQATTKASSPAPVTQISDGQIQASTATAKPVPVTQISDGQIQATTLKTTGAPVTQISDGQLQATSARTSAPATFTGAAAALNYGSYGAAVIGAAAMALL